MDPNQLLQRWLHEIGIKHGKDLLDDLKGEPAKIVTATLTDIAKLRTREVAGDDISSEVAFAESTLKDMTVAVEIKTARTILQVLADSFDMLGSALGGIATDLLNKLPL